MAYQNLYPVYAYLDDPSVKQIGNRSVLNSDVIPVVYDGTPQNSVVATGVLYPVSQYNDGDTCSIGFPETIQVYTFKTVLTSPEASNEVLIGSDVSSTLANLVAAINKTFWNAYTREIPSITLYGVSFTDANTGTVVGEGGTILRTTDGGTTWITQTSGISNELYGVSFTDANTGTVVGQSGAILRTTDGGGTWNLQLSGTANDLFGVSFTDANTGTVVGEGGTILRTTDGGENWNMQTSGTTNELRSVSFANASTGTAVGDYGKILRTNNGGVNWSTQSSGTTNLLIGVSFSDANNGTAVGNSGKIIHTTNGGINWNSQSSGTTSTLYGVSFSDANNGIAVGQSGTIIRTTNGGVSWNLQSSGTANDLNSVSFTNANAGTVVGSDGTILRTTSGYKYGSNTIKNVSVDADDAGRLLAKVKGALGNNIITVSSNPDAFAFDNSTLTGGIDGTVADKYTMYIDGSYLWIATDKNTVSDANWKKIGWVE